MEDPRKEPRIDDFGSTAANLSEISDYYPNTASPALEAVFKTAELYGPHDFGDLSKENLTQNSFWQFAKKFIGYNFLAIVCGGLLGAGLAFATISGELDKYKQTIFSSLKSILQLSGFSADSQKILNVEQDL
ncbi:MAG: hypothetical protein KBD78_11465 [Oligoflexales bacterium]|nr:hypothetical protein [Oligoflexales bacterium]